MSATGSPAAASCRRWSRCPSARTRSRRSCATCAAHGVPFVARGAGSGLSGGALPVAEGIVISLARMTRVLEVDVDARLRRRRARRHEPRRHARGRRARLLLRARPLLAAGLHDRRQRRRELGRRALPEVRLHRQPRARRRRRAARRRAGHAVGLGRRARPARRLRRLGGHARDRDGADAARAARAGGGPHAARGLRSHRRGRRRGVARSSPRASRRRRSR